MHGFARQNGFFGLSGLGPGSSSSGPTLDEQIADAFAAYVAHSAVVTAYNVADYSTASMSSSRTLVVQTGLGDVLGQLFDQKGSIDLNASSSNSRRPALTALGVVYDGLDDTLQTVATNPFPSLTLTAQAIIRPTSSSNARPFINLSAASPRMEWASGGGAAPIVSGSGSAYVDGTVRTTTGDLFTAVTAGGLRLLEWRGLVGNEITGNFVFGQSNTAQITGPFMPIGFIDEGGSDVAGARALGAAFGALLATKFNP